ncbi:MAG: amidohydrolase family protein [Bdellovibrionota bacterium]
MGGILYGFKNTNEESQKDLLSHKSLQIRKNVDVVICNGVFAEIGEHLLKKYEQLPQLQIIDAQNLVLMPGLIDCHTHSIFAGSRSNETILKSQGLSFDEIAKKGGGIISTVKATRACTKEELTHKFKVHAQQALSRGVVLLETKTGYGLNVAEEKKLLESLYDAYLDNTQHDLPMLAPTYFGPHTESPDFRGLDNYLQTLVEDLPNIALMGDNAVKKGIALPLAADIFLERNYFTKEHASIWLGACLQHGLDIHIHADEFSRSGGAEIAVELARRLEQTSSKKRDKGRVLSVDHCQYATESDLIKLSKLGVAAVVLPATSFFSNIPYIDSGRLRSSEIRVAIASNFNPGTAPMNNLWFSCYLSLSQCGFSLAEIYAGVTINAAFALGVENSFGSIEQGKRATMVGFLGNAPEDFFNSPIGDHVQYVVL